MSVLIRTKIHGLDGGYYKKDAVPKGIAALKIAEKLDTLTLSEGFELAKLSENLIQKLADYILKGK